MSNLTQAEEIGNAIGGVLARALVVALRDPEVVEAMRGVTATSIDTTGEIDGKTLDKVKKWSRATRARHDKAGMPGQGHGRLRRYVLVAVNAWLASRSGAVRETIDGEVAQLAKRAGLAVVRGVR